MPDITPRSTEGQPQQFSFRLVAEYNPFTHQFQVEQNDHLLANPEMQLAIIMMIIEARTRRIIENFVPVAIRNHLNEHRIINPHTGQPL